MRAIFNRLGLLSLILATGFAFAPSAQAAGDSSGWIGANVGMSVPNSEGTTARPIMGVNGGAMLGTEFGLGAYYLTSSKDETVNGVTGTFTYSFYGVDFTYHFEGEAAGAYFGGRLGMSRVSSKLCAQARPSAQRTLMTPLVKSLPRPKKRTGALCESHPPPAAYS